MLKLAVLVSGGGSNLQAIIDEIENKNLDAEIISVISSNKNAFALQRCEKHNINTNIINPKEPDFENKLILYLSEIQPDLIVLAGFMLILSEKFVHAFNGKIINIHPSLIPSFCGKGFYGLKVHEAALEHGVKITGATVHYVDEGTDTGKIILQKAVNVLDGDTPEILQKRVMKEAEWVIYPQAIAMIARGEA